jgi:DNA polymerase-3 subunit alpha
MLIPSITTHYSLLKGFIKPDEAAKKCKELGYTHCLLADNSLSGVVEFFSCMKKEGVVPIIGWKADGGHYIVKSLNGYKTLIKLVSGENIIYEDKDLQYYKDGELALMSVYYAEEKDAILHRISLCSGFKTTLKKAKDVDMGEYKKFFESDHYFFHPTHRIIPTKTQHFANEQLISELEDYTIFSKPKLPKVDCQGQTEEEYITQLCRDGWKKKLSHLKGDKRNEYADRVKYELSIINGFGLAGYFLIVQDIIAYVRNNGWLPGPGRGSAGGCLVSYLLGITEIDPVKYDLLFSRFLNSGRFSKDNISLPDIDMDVPSQYRDQIIDYLKDKYGHSRVFQMITFGRLQGRSVIKEVARIYADLSFSELNEITESLPQEASISDELEEMDIKSVILWTLENKPDKLEKWCKLDKEGNLTGELSDMFDLAIRIEGTYKSQGKHPAGVIISNDDLINDAPLIKDREGNPIVGFEMHDLDKVGLTKFDVLGVNLLDKIMEITHE